MVRASIAVVAAAMVMPLVGAVPNPKIYNVFEGHHNLERSLEKPKATTQSKIVYMPDYATNDYGYALGLTFQYFDLEKAEKFDKEESKNMLSYLATTSDSRNSMLTELKNVQNIVQKSEISGLNKRAEELRSLYADKIKPLYEGGKSVSVEKIAAILISNNVALSKHALLDMQMDVFHLQEIAQLERAVYE